MVLPLLVSTEPSEVVRSASAPPADPAAVPEFPFPPAPPLPDEQAAAMPTTPAAAIARTPARHPLRISSSVARCAPASTGRLLTRAGGGGGSTDQRTAP